MSISILTVKPPGCNTLYHGMCSEIKPPLVKLMSHNRQKCTHTHIHTNTETDQCLPGSPCCRQSEVCRAGPGTSGWRFEQLYSRRDAVAGRPPASAGLRRSATSSSSCSRCGSQTGHLWSPQNADDKEARQGRKEPVFKCADVRRMNLGKPRQ